LQQAIVTREEQGETLSRMLPGGIADRLKSDPAAFGRTERLTVTVLMSDVRGYTGIAEHTDPTVLADQLRSHRSEMNAAILDLGGTVMQYVGDAVMAVFGAPFPQADHAAAAVAAATEMHKRQTILNDRWISEGSEPFGLGIGLSTGDVAAAMLGSDERVEYTLVGDTVNLAQRFQDLARPAGTTVMSAATALALPSQDGLEDLGPLLVKGRETAVTAYRLTGPTLADASIGFPLFTKDRS
jgi:class 3 adenylate cyclase